jgi:hypothetical protein
MDDGWIDGCVVDAVHVMSVVLLETRRVRQ